VIRIYPLILFEPIKIKLSLKNGRMIELKGIIVEYKLQMITTIKTLKSLKEVVYGFVMQFFFIRVCEEHKQVVKRLKVKAFLEEYKLVFVEPKHLSPVKKFDHRIPLIPKAKPFNIRLYKSSLVHDKDIKKLLKKL